MDDERDEIDEAMDEVAREKAAAPAPENVPVKRVIGRPFPKGQPPANGGFQPGNQMHKRAGNPHAGKIEKLRHAMIRAIDEKDISDMIAVARRVAMKETLLGQRCREWLFDRVLGKVVQPISAEVDATMSPEDIQRRISALLGASVTGQFSAEPTDTGGVKFETTGKNL